MKKSSSKANYRRKAANPEDVHGRCVQGSGLVWPPERSVGEWGDGGRPGAGRDLAAADLGSLDSQCSSPKIVGLRKHLGLHHALTVINKPRHGP